MPTYTKETALYDTGKIATDIAGAGETASKYITAIDENGIKVHAENNPSTNYTKIDANGMEVYQGVDNVATKVASFGAGGAQLGEDDSYNLSISSNGVTGVDENNFEYFGINYDPTEEDTRDVTSRLNRYELSKIPAGTTTKTYRLTFRGIPNGTVVTIPASVTMLYFTIYNDNVSYTASSLSGLRFVSESAYTRSYANLLTNGSKTFTIGTSKTLSYSGRLTASTSETFHFEVTLAYDGTTNVLTYTYIFTAASGLTSRLYAVAGEGARLTFSASYHPTSIHVGNTVTQMEKYSAAFGLGLRSTQECQTVVGMFNSTSDGLFVVGDGTASSAHNAFVVGTDSIKMNNPATLNSGATVYGDLSVLNGDITANNIGAMLTHFPSAISCATGKWFQVAYLTLTPGVWLLDCNAQFLQTNATGTRQIRVSTVTSGYNNVTTAPAPYGNIAIDILVGANTTQYPQVHFPVEVSEDQTFRLIAYQGSGSTINVQGRMYATRLK